MNKKIKIVYSNYYLDEITSKMLEISKKKLRDFKLVEFDLSGVPGSFDIPFEIARSIEEDIIDIENQTGTFEGKDKKEISTVFGDEWHAANLSYHLKSRPKWIFESISSCNTFGGVVFSLQLASNVKVCVVGDK